MRGTAICSQVPGAGSGRPITGASGTFSDTNTGVNISNASVTGVIASHPATPQDAVNDLAPNSFSIFSSHVTYDDLYYPGGSPGVATDYSPYDGMDVTGWPESVLVRGHVVMDRGQLQPAVPGGRAVAGHEIATAAGRGPSRRPPG